MAYYINPQETAGILAEELKGKFPSTNFSITNDSGSVYIKWFDGVDLDEVQAFVSRFEGKYYDELSQEEKTREITYQGKKCYFDTYITCDRKLIEKTNISNDTFILASSIFLTEQYPNNWAEMSEEELNNFILDHAWQPFENYPASEILDNIGSAARGIHKHICTLALG